MKNELHVMYLHKWGSKKHLTPHPHDNGLASRECVIVFAAHQRNAGMRQENKVSLDRVECNICRLQRSTHRCDETTTKHV